MRNILVECAWRFFLEEFYTFQALAYTNRAAGQLGPKADTIPAFAGLRAGAGGGEPADAQGCLYGSGGQPGARLRRRDVMVDLGLLAIDELSQVEDALFNKVNQEVTSLRRDHDGIGRFTHTELPFGMLPLVLLMGDPAQLTMPNSTTLFEWKRIFHLLEVARHSPKVLRERVTGNKREGGDDTPYWTRYLKRNGLTNRSQIPPGAPQPGDDPARPPAVPTAQMVRREREFPRDRSDACDVQRQASEAYCAFQDCVFLVHTQRFKSDDGDWLRRADGSPLPVRALKTVSPHDPLPTMLRLMREGRLATHGEPIPKPLFEEVLGEARTTPRALETPGAFPTGGVTTIAHQWDFLQGVYMRTARALAADAGQMLYYIVARDEEAKKAQPLTRMERKVLRHHPNPNVVGSRCGVLPIFEGMRVELSAKFSAKANVLKASQGVIEQVLFAGTEPTDRLENPDSVERRRGWAVLEQMPAILLRVDGFTDGAIPGRPDLLIVVAARSETFTWKSKTTGLRTQTKCSRFQLPLLPVSGASCFTAQGMTAEWALVHLEPHEQLNSLHAWWSQVYVALRQGLL